MIDRDELIRKINMAKEQIAKHQERETAGFGGEQQVIRVGGGRGEVEAEVTAGGGDSLIDDSAAHVDNEIQSHKVDKHGARLDTFSPKFDDKQGRRFTVNSGQNQRLKQLRSPNRPDGKQVPERAI